MKRLEFRLPLLEEVKIEVWDDQLADFAQRQLKNYLINISSFNLEEKICVTIICNNSNLLTIANSFLNTDKIFSKQFRVKNHRMHLFNSEIFLEDKFFYKSTKNVVAKFYADYPIFSMYSLVGNFFLVHGSFVKIGNKNILITGLEGVGKSSLSNELQKNGCEVLADNFVLFNGKEVCPLNMAMRLDLCQPTGKLRVLYEDNNLKEILPELVVHQIIKPDEILILTISDIFEFREVKLDVMSLILFLNNACEIGAANNFISPFLIKDNEGGGVGVKEALCLL
ncbi:MAG: hypothetical protein LBS29_05565 [Endomicrobium sp.]|nr:hypothetical protein [Endomicrobium sp.]